MACGNVKLPLAQRPPRGMVDVYMVQPYMVQPYMADGWEDGWEDG